MGSEQRPAGSSEHDASVRAADEVPDTNVASASTIDWETALEEERSLILGSKAGPITPPAVLQALQRVRVLSEAVDSASTVMRGEMVELKLENVHLRAALSSRQDPARAAAAQAQRVLMDPAAQKEMARLRAMADARAQELLAVREELQLLRKKQQESTRSDQTDEGATIRALEDRVVTLQRRCRDLEGDVHALEADREELQSELSLLREIVPLREKKEHRREHEDRRKETSVSKKTRNA
ncbi:hypothetical protein H632_c349p1 [Helicosporidium sp. ATCC 50920]|nr:hypothetical protein H632_c349p1 [Helicosporidium sp. ATCC 50920]|eukprot:KDD76115.1 hypothetical protein H632_c349p1 [Helicosporidium sp. ATCC 50920]